MRPVRRTLLRIHGPDRPYVFPERLTNQALIMQQKLDAADLELERAIATSDSACESAILWSADVEALR